MKHVIAREDRDSERGAVSMKLVLTLLVLSAVVFVLIKTVPVYVEEGSVKHAIDEFANKIAMRNPKPGDVEKELEKIRKEYDLPEGSISVAGTQDHPQVAVNYNRTIDLLVTTYNWKVDYRVSGKSF